MRLRIFSFICVILLLSGCKCEGSPLDRALSLRSRIEESDGCSFHTTITADYGEQIYIFGMDCRTDDDGDLYFTVTQPSTIAGITGKISHEGGQITFDNKVLAFRTMADGQITPVSAPWVLMRSLTGGYMKDCTGQAHEYLVSIDDSYEEDALHLSIAVSDGKPVSGEIFWQGRRVLTLTVEGFEYL